MKALRISQRCLAVAVGVSLIPLTSWADFQFKAASPPPPPAAVTAETLPNGPTSLVPLSGVTPTAAATLAKPAVWSSGKDMPLAAALRMLAPRTYKIDMPAEYQARTVSFKGKGRSWDLVLTEALASAGLAVSISDDSLTIAINSGAGGTPFKNATDTVIPVAAVAVAPVQQIAPVPAVQETWVIRDGSTLKSTLKEWTTQAGFKLLWNAKDERGKEVNWPIDAGGTITGNFIPVDDKDHSVVEDLLAGFDQADRKPRVHISTKINRVVEVYWVE